MTERHGPQPAGLRIIANIDQAAGCCRLAQAADKCRADWRRDPAIHAVQGHIVKPAKIDRPLLRQCDEVTIAELDVRQPRRLRDGARMGDMVGQEVDADKLALGVGSSQQA